MLTESQCRSLRCLAEMMIPASAEYGVPSAGDVSIFGDILRSLGCDAGHVIAVLQTLDTMSGGLLGPATPRSHCCTVRETSGEALTHLTRIILRCYYRDDRVMRSLGVEPRPPFPKGFEVEQGDWSLLDPVRAPETLSRRRLTEIGTGGRPGPRVEHVRNGERRNNSRHGNMVQRSCRCGGRLCEPLVFHC
jgi:hypothetical protein